MNRIAHRTAPNATTAFLFTDWHGPDSCAMGTHHALLPMIGKSMLQRSVEHLVRLGCRRIIVLLGEDSGLFRSTLGNGERWGCDIQFRYSQPGETLSQLTRGMDANSPSHCWLADVQTLPTLSVLETCGSMRVDDHGSTLCWADIKELHWSGWGFFSVEWLQEQASTIDHAALEKLILSTLRVERKNVPRPMTVSDAASLLSSQIELLSVGKTPHTTIGRDCHIDPSAHLIAPIQLQDHVRIGPGCVIGPYVVIGENCIIDADVRIQSSAVLPDCYLGEGLELNYSVVHGQKLANIAHGTMIEIDDRNILRNLSEPRDPGVLEQWTARGLQLVLTPLRWLCMLRNGDVMRPANAPYLPEATDGQRMWVRHFAQVFFPALREVADGKYGMVGPVPRSTDDIERLPNDWRRLYDIARPGLLSEALTRFPAEIGEEERFASDALASARHSVGKTSVFLLARYLSRVVVDLLPQIVQNLVQASANAGTVTNNQLINHRSV